MNYNLTEGQKADWEVKRLQIIGIAIFDDKPISPEMLTLIEIEKIDFFRKCFVENKERK